MKKLLLVALLLSVWAYGAEAKVKGKVLDGKRIEVKTDAPGTFTLVYEDAGTLRMHMIRSILSGLRRSFRSMKVRDAISLPISSSRKDREI